MLNKKLLQDAQQVVTAGLVGQGVQVVYDTDTPYADLKNRVMHLRPLPEEVDEQTVLHLRADCDHEMGHFLGSDPDALEFLKDPLARVLSNAIEDGYVERLVSERWWGCGENLRKSNEMLIGQLTEADDDSEDYVRKLAITALQLLTFGYSKDEVLKTLGDRVEEDVEAIEDLIPQLQGVSNTFDSVKMAQAVDRRWWWTDPERPEGRTGDDGDDSDEGDESGESGGTSESEDEGGGGESDSSSSASPSAKEPEETSEHRQSMADRLSDGTLSAARKKSIAKAPLVESRYHARLDDDVVEDIEPFDHADGVNQFVESVRAVVPTLRRRLLMEFRGVGTRREFNKKRGEVDRESLHKVAVGNPRVFTQDTPHEVPGADVTLLVDASGSMMCYGGRGAAGSRIYVASQAAYAFSQVLDLIKVPNEVLAFTTEVHYDIEACAHHRSEGGAYTRVRPLRHMVVKPEGTSFRSRKAHFARLAYFDRCAENIDGEGVMWAARRLAARNRAGMAPILIVFSDGAPASVPESMSLLSWHLKHTVQRVEKSGIHVIGVGIQTDSVKRFFKNHLMISDVSDLVGTSYSILRAVLRKATRVR